MWIFSLGTWPLGTCEAVGVPAGRFRGSLASGGTWVAEIPNQVWRSPAPCADKSFRQTPGPPLAIYARINPPTLSPRVDGPLREGGEDSCGRRSYAVCASGGSYVVLPTPAPVIPEWNPYFSCAGDPGASLWLLSENGRNAFTAFSFHRLVRAPGNVQNLAKGRAPRLV